MAGPSQSFQQLQKQTQQLVLAPQLRHSLKILQVPALELATTIQAELQANPVLEELPMESISIEGTNSEGNGEATDAFDAELKKGFEIIRQLDEDNREAYYQNGSGPTAAVEDQEKRQHFFDSFVGETSLQEHLIQQAELSDHTPDVLKALHYLIGSLDDRGFLQATLDDLSLESGLPLDTLQQASELLKSLDPPGIGAANVQECLHLQLVLRGRKDSTAARIIKNHFDLLLRRRIPELARKTGQELEEIERALEEIATLDPAPGRKFAEDSNRSIVADVIVEKDGDEWSIILNNDYIPRLRISSTYKDMIARGNLSRQEKEYILEKMRSGRFLISSIEQRQQTIERITREILKVQTEFFEEGVSKLRPLTMTQIADAVGVHETTVSRAIANKYIKTPHGLFEFKYFFTPGYKGSDGESISNKSIKDMISHLIEQEPPGKPYSDQEIVERLAEKNIKIARRTVAKYREEMGILPTNLRRRYR